MNFYRVQIYYPFTALPRDHHHALVLDKQRVTRRLFRMLDMGKQFTSGLMKEIGRLLSIRQLTTTPYNNPACNGRVERFNGTLKSVLKKNHSCVLGIFPHYFLPTEKHHMFRVFSL